MSVDTSMLRKPLDVSRMSISWVQDTNDPLFSNLSKQDRYLLYLLYAWDTPVPSIAKTTPML